MPLVANSDCGIVLQDFEFLVRALYLNSGNPLIANRHRPAPEDLEILECLKLS